MSRGTVILDLDGVLYDFAGAFVSWAMKVDGVHYSHPNEIGEWNFYKAWGWTTEQFLVKLEEFAMQDGFIGVPEPGARELVEDLRRAGFTVVFATDRPVQAHRGTLWWVSTWFSGYSTADKMYYDPPKVYFTRNKPDAKAGGESPYFALDDKPENVVELKAAGVFAVLMRRPWNEGFSGTWINNISHLKNLVTGMVDMTDAVGVELNTAAEHVMSADPELQPPAGIYDGSKYVGAMPADLELEALLTEEQEIMERVTVDQAWAHEPKVSTDEVIVTDPDTGGKKGTKSARFDLLPTRALHYLATHYGKGASKYGDRNWELGYSWSLSYAALQRHLNAFWSGEDTDEETGSSHLDAAAFHILALRTFVDTHPEKDDRSK